MKQFVIRRLGTSPARLEINFAQLRFCSPTLTSRAVCCLETIHPEKYLHWGEW
jgi:hypothetical protein